MEIPPSTPIFDCHVHVPDGLVIEWAPATPDVPATLACMARCGIRGGVLMSSRARAPDAATFLDASRKLPEVCRQAGKAYVPGLSMRGEYVAESINMLRLWRAAGYCWAGECCPYASGGKPDSEGWRSILAEAARLEMILHVHCNPADMDTMAAAMPATTFVYPHFPASGREVGELVEVLRRRPNVYFDISGSQFVRMGVLELVVQAVGSQRVLFGSDLTVTDPATVIARVLFANISEADKRQIFAESCIELLRKHGTNVDVSHA